MQDSQKLRRVVVLAAALVVGAGGLLQAAENASEARMRHDITFLASDECEGRGPGTKGIDLAADFIASEFKKAGLKPLGSENSYFQPFTMAGAAELMNPNTVVLRGPLGQEIQLTLGRQFYPLGLSGARQVDAPLVFAGYGATSKEVGYDDFRDVDVAGKVVVILRKTPRPASKEVPFDGKQSMHHAALTTKIGNAEKHKAAAILFVNDRDMASREDRLMDFNYTSLGYGMTKLPVIHIRRVVVDALVKSGLGHTLTELEQDIDRDLKPRSALLPGWTAHLDINVRRPTLAVKNVVGVLDGYGPKAEETVVLGAHYDHLGYGGLYSLAGPSVHAIHHGADDNGSGTTMLLELARRLGQMPRSQHRRLVFIAFSGEESGLLGSLHYCKHPLIPLDETVAMVNMDMVGRLRSDKETHQDKVIVQGTQTAKQFDQLLDGLNKAYDFKFKKEKGGRGPSDHTSFYEKKVPVFFIWTGDHPDYHRPSDTADKINIAGMYKIAGLVEQLVTALVTSADRPEYVQVAEPRPRGGYGTGGPRLGIRPSYADDKEGVLLDGVAGGGPAAKAGLKEGDRITEISGKPVKSLEGYMALMGGHKNGDTIEVGILRDGKKMTIKVKTE